MTTYKNELSNQTSDSANRGLNRSSSTRSSNDSTPGSQSQYPNNPIRQNTISLNQTQSPQSSTYPNSKHPFSVSRRKNVCFLNNKHDLNLIILQWNIKGLLNNLDELSILIKDQNPSIISLQETHCPFNTTPIVPKNYIGYFKNLPSNTTAKQGISLLVKKDLPHKIRHINSNILTFAVDIEFKPKVTYVCIYIHPQQKFCKNDLDNIISQTDSPVILGGDINAWNTLWGSSVTNKRGEIFENFLQNENLILLNDGSRTHLSTHNTLTHIDVTCCSPSLFLNITWNTLNDLHNSDHFPIILMFKPGITRSKTSPIAKYKTDFSNWTLFGKIITEYLSDKPPTTITNKEAALIQKAIRTAANVAIPQTTPIHSPKIKRTVPWWNQTLSILRKDKMNALKEFQKSPSQCNLILYKKANAKFRRELKQSKTKSFSEFTSSINPRSTATQIWQNIRLLTGKPDPLSLSYIHTINKVITDPAEISDLFSKIWSDYSNDKNFPSHFKAKKDEFNNSLPYTPNTNTLTNV